MPKAVDLHCKRLCAEAQWGILLGLQRPQGVVIQDKGGRMPRIDVLQFARAEVTRDASDVIHLSLVNTHPRQSVSVVGEMKALSSTSVTGRILSANELNAHNTFDNPNVVHPVPFDGTRLSDGELALTLPPKSVVMIRLAD